MDTVTLGRTGLSVSVVGLGAGGRSRLGLARGLPFEACVDLVQGGLERGINLIDTAELYGTEAIVGAAIAGRREKVVISTKIRVTKPGADPESKDFESPQELRNRFEKSLAALGTDYVDILHLHGIMPNQYDYCLDALVPVIETLRREGKVRFLGLTERFSTDTRHEMSLRAVEDDVWDVMLVGLNFVNMTALRELLPRAAARGIGILVMFAVRGPLANRADLAALVDDLIDRGEIDPREIEGDPALDFLVAPEVAKSLTDAAYRFVRHAPGVDAVLTGTGNLAHLDENIASLHAPPLPETVRARLERIFGSVTLVAPN